MHSMEELLLNIIASIITGGLAGFVVTWMGIKHYKRSIALVGDDNGSISVDGKWYVIKREGV